MNGWRTLSTFERALAKGGASLLSSSGRGGRGLLVLIYHRVLPVPDPILHDIEHADRFAAQMELLASCFNVLPLAEAVERLATRSLPLRAVSVTFDDGYADNLTVAAPIMRRFGIRGTVFVASGYLDGGLMFNDAITEALRQAPSRFDLSDLGHGVLDLLDASARRTQMDRLIGALKYRPVEERRQLAMEVLARAGGAQCSLMLTTAQLRELRDAGVEIGAHTSTHPILTRLEADAARNDIAVCKETLQGILGGPVRLFAYPNGRPGQDYDARHVVMARELGFSAAVSTAWGVAYSGCDPFQVPRVAPWDKSSGRYAARLLRSYTQRDYALAGQSVSD